MREAWERARPALIDIAASSEPALIVTHKALMRLILTIAGAVDPEIKRGRLYPMTLRPTGLPRDPEPPARLVPR